MPLNQACAGKQYPARRSEVTRDAIEKYARACDDLNPHYLGPTAALLAPPMFGAPLVWQSVMDAIGDPELGVDMLHLVHSAHEVEFYEPIRAGDTITSTAMIRTIESEPNGESLVLELAAHNQRGALVQLTRFTVFIRGPRAGRPARRRPGESIAPQTAPLAEISYPIAPDQTRRYAEASGDFNPIHLDETVARMAGLPGIILHGLCTMALCCKAVVDRLCDGDPRRLKRLRVRFTRPVLPGQTITVRIWPAGQNEGRAIYEFDTINPAGQAVIREGLAEVAPPA